MIRKKILLLGDFNVGKTSLIRRYVDNAFDDKYLTTIGVKISKKLCTLTEQSCEMIIWDIEGTTPNKEIPLMYYRGASGAIIVADVNRKETVENIDKHKQIFLMQNPDAFFVVAYNKSDLLSEEMQNMIMLDSYTLLTSAKENINIETLFSTLMEQIIS